MVKDIIYICMDAVNYLLQGILLIMLLQITTKRFQFRLKHITEILLILQYMAVQMILHYSVFVKQILYGQSQIVTDSRQSIILIFISMGVTYLTAMIVLTEQRLKLFYEIVTFYSIQELVRFAFYVIFLRVYEWTAKLNLYLYIEKSVYKEDVFLLLTTASEIVWNLLSAAIILFISYKIIRKIKNYMISEEKYQTGELLFLLTPSVIGITLCVMIRSMMFSMNGTNMNLLLDKRPEMNICIPLISILCIALIILAAKMLRKLLDESQKKIEVSVYQNRIREMELHIQDIESLYAGIRGMRHDMRNYIADMDALMKQNEVTGCNQKSLKQYLDSLQNSVDQLDMKYHTDNPVTDVILQRYVKLAEKDVIAFQADFIYPSNMNLDAFDLSIIMNNALENAIEACKKMTEGNKYIELRAYRRENMFFLIIRNSFNGEIKRDKETGFMLTTKEKNENHGFGIKNIQVCAEKYYGKTETKIEKNVFELAVMLQGRE